MKIHHKVEMIHQMEIQDKIRDKQIMVLAEVTTVVIVGIQEIPEDQETLGVQDKAQDLFHHYKAAGIMKQVHGIIQAVEVTWEWISI